MVTHPSPRSARLLVVVLVSCSLAVITLDYRQGESGPLAGVGRAAAGAMAPLQRAATGVIRPIGDFFSGLAHLPSLQKENRRLNDRILDLQTSIAANGNYRELYLETLALLGLQQLNPGSIAATVIAKGVSSTEWTITIDKGSADGIALNQTVVTGTADTARLVGKVVRVTTNSADVQLILDRRYAAFAVLGVSGETGTIEGQGSADLRMSFVTPTTRIEANEAVFTESYSVEGLQGLNPPGILIGTVSRLVPSNNEIQAFVSVRPAVDFSELRFVLVLKTSKASS